LLELSRNTPQKQAVFPSNKLDDGEHRKAKIVDLGTKHVIVRYLDAKYDI